MGNRNLIGITIIINCKQTKLKNEKESKLMKRNKKKKLRIFMWKHTLNNHNNKKNIGDYMNL